MAAIVDHVVLWHMIGICDDISLSLYIYIYISIMILLLLLIILLLTILPLIYIYIYIYVYTHTTNIISYNMLEGPVEGGAGQVCYNIRCYNIM